jgi:hypothetical protein
MGISQAKVVAIATILVALALTQWAFRFHAPTTPVDSFVRLLVLATVVLLSVPTLVLLISNKGSAQQTLRTTLKKWPRSSALYLGLVMTFGLVLVIEFSCRYFFKHIYKAPHVEQTLWHPSSNPLEVKGDTIHHRYFVNDTLIYDLRYTIDSIGRRSVPLLRPDSTYKEFALLQVCSYPFGYGLSDGQTFARALDSICGLHPYNYSIAGQGPQHIAAMLHTTDLHSQIKERNGRLIYLFIDDHIPRLIGSRRLIKMWAARFPYTYLKGEKLFWNRTFIDGRPFITRLYMVLSKSAFIDLFNIEIPRWTFDHHLKLAAKVVANAKEEFHWHYPNGEFLVIIAPNSTLASRFIRELNKENVQFLDYSALLDKELPEYKIHRTEGHPNGLYYQRIAEELKGYLEENPLP